MPPVQSPQGRSALRDSTLRPPSAFNIKVYAMAVAIVKKQIALVTPEASCLKVLFFTGE